MIAVLVRFLQMQHAKKKQREIRRIDNHPLHDQERGRSRGARHGRSEDQRAYHQAEDSSKKAHKKGFESILHHFQMCEVHLSSQTNIKWTEELCKHLEEWAREDHSYVATWQERQRYEKVRKLCLNSQGLTCRTNAVTSCLS